MASRYIGQINAKYNSTDIIITPDRAAADQDGAPIVNTTGAQSISGAKTFTGSTTISGTLTAPNTSNTLKVANHTSVLTGNDVLSAKDIMTVNGDANNLLHRYGASQVCLSSVTFSNSSVPIQVETPTGVGYGRKVTNVDSDTQPTSGETIRLFNLVDKNGKLFFRLNCVRNASGKVSLQIEGYPFIDGVRTYKSINFATLE